MSELPTIDLESEEFELWDCRVELWGSDGDECLNCSDIHEYIDTELAQYTVDEAPKTLVVWGYVRDTISESDRHSIAVRVAENILESLGEDYGDWDNPKETTDQHVAIARKAVDKISADFQVWSCQAVVCVTVDVEDWIAKYGDAL